ncbi:MAG TPA: hypothetical protein VGL02_18945, partial [Streptomyces sp.]
QQLLDDLRASRRPVTTTGQVRELNSSLGAPKRTTARRDVAALVAAGELVPCGGEHARFYLLSRKETA